MNPESFAAFMSGVESIITSLALIIGGLWALYTFRVLNQITRGRLETQKMQFERDKMEIEIRKTQKELQQLELQAKTQAVIQITIEASQQSLPDDSSLYVSAIVEIENKGNRNTRLSYEGRDPFLVTPIKISERGEMRFENSLGYPVRLASNPQGKAPGTIVRAGGREQLPFFFRVEAPGLYMLSFAVRLSPEEQKTASEAGTPEGRPTSWTGKKLIVVS
jgi:hypothetical protein